MLKLYSQLTISVSIQQISERDLGPFFQYKCYLFSCNVKHGLFSESSATNTDSPGPGAYKLNTTVGKAMAKSMTGRDLFEIG